MAEKTPTREVKIAGRLFRLRAIDVTRALRKVDPEPLTSHYVVIARRRFPPKQVISEVTGLDRADFTSHQARRTLMRLGFTAGRRGAGLRTGDSNVRFEVDPASPEPAHEGLADQLRSLTGQWVAIKDGDVLRATDTPRELVDWLLHHGQRADSMFRVPEDALAATGLAPL
jgi:hypothetical protein